jgi:hypothetical protein
VDLTAETPKIVVAVKAKLTVARRKLRELNVKKGRVRQQGSTSSRMRARRSGGWTSSRTGGRGDCLLHKLRALMLDTCSAVNGSVVKAKAIAPFKLG